MQQSTHSQSILQILQKSYEDRSEQQQSILINFLSVSLNNSSQEECRWLSLLCQLLDNLSNEQHRSRIRIETGSILICFQDYPPWTSLLKIEIQAHLERLPNEGFAVMIGHRQLRTCSALSQQTIEEVIKSLRSLEYLSEIPKKRLFHMLRNMEVLHFVYGEIVYLEKQSIAEVCNVFLIREGDFTFLKREKETHKNVELCTFEEGHIFGCEEQNLQGQGLRSQRAYTVKCQSKGILYSFTLDFFNAFMRKSCEGLLHLHNQKLKRFLEERFMRVEASLVQNAQYITQPFKRSISVQLTRSDWQLIPQGKNAKKEQIKEPNKKEKREQRLPSLNIKAEFPNRKRLLSRESLKKLDPDYQEEKIILMKQYRCEAVRQATKPKITPLSRGEVLLNLLKTSFQFEKAKLKKSLP